MHCNGILIALAAAFTLSQPLAQAAVVYSENFDDISDWTVTASGATSIAAVAGKLQVQTGDSFASGSQGLHLTSAVVPLSEGRIYFWGFIPNGTRTVDNPSNNGPGPVGAFNLSETSGLHFFDDATLGAYIRNRDEPGTGFVTELQLIADEDNPGAHPNLAEESGGFDILIEYSGTTATMYLKNSAGTTWGTVSSDSFTPGSGDYFLNLSLIAEGPTGEGAKWELDQIDIENVATGDRLTAPVPEPASLVLLAIGGVLVFARRRQKLVA